MSKRFFRCRVCHLPHETGTVICPLTNQPIPSRSRSLLALQQVSAPASQPVIPPVQSPSVPAKKVPPPLPPAALQQNIKQPVEPRPEEDTERVEIAIPKEAMPRATQPRSSQPNVNVNANVNGPAVSPTIPRVSGQGVIQGSSEPAKVSLSPSRSMGFREGVIGSIIDGRYHVQSVLAEGGMGIVYDAVHLGLGRRVALKIMTKKGIDDPVAVARFRNEARLAGSLVHPNIVEVFDMGVLADGAPYLVMERLEGETLAQRLRREHIVRSIDDVVNILLQILSALAAAHERSILHRDLKPENIYLAQRSGAVPVVKILDFGISKVMRSADEERGNTLTRAGFVMGTPSYMAPEQARGERNLDARVDVYAAGVLGYEMLIGRVPYNAKLPTTLLIEMQKGPPASPKQLRTEVPSWLDAVVMKLLSLSRRARFQTAKDVISVMQQAHAIYTGGNSRYAGYSSGGHSGNVARPPSNPGPIGQGQRLIGGQGASPGTPAKPSDKPIDADASQRVEIFTRPQSK